MAQAKRTKAERVSIRQLEINRDKVKAAGTASFSQSDELAHLYTIAIAIVERLEKIESRLESLRQPPKR